MGNRDKTLGITMSVPGALSTCSLGRCCRLGHSPPESVRIVLYIHIHACMHACIHTYTHTHIHIHTYTHTHIRRYRHKHIYIYMCLYITRCIPSVYIKERSRAPKMRAAASELRSPKMTIRRFDAMALSLHVCSQAAREEAMGGV